MVQWLGCRIIKSLCRHCAAFSFCREVVELAATRLIALHKNKELDAEYSKLLTEKKALYPDYRKAKEEMQELLRARRNVELFFAEEKSSSEKTKSR